VVAGQLVVEALKMGAEALKMGVGVGQKELERLGQTVS
jgi:hypothetical protein